LALSRGVAREALENFGHDDAGHRERLGVRNHAAQLFSGRTRSGTEEINPYRAID